MIHKTKSGMHVQIGTGDILMCIERWSENRSDTMVSFREHEPRPIGASATDEEIKLVESAPVVLEFTDPGSIDVLIDLLTKLRAEFQAPTMVGPLPSNLSDGDD